MAIERLIEEINKLTTSEKEELFRRLGIAALPSGTQELRGGPDDPLARLIGMFKGPGTGSLRYKEDLYGGPRPL